MQTVRSIASMQRLSRRITSRGERIALVPTMGFLHEGHLSLIRNAREKADIVIVSIFVNPAQFGKGEDYKTYPREENRDKKAIKLTGGDVLFSPAEDEMYHADHCSWVDTEKLSERLEGSIRPGHFRGVCTIVSKLYNITRPDVALFGMKDYQQAILLRRMTRELNYPIKFIIVPTVREADGLAMSSRNAYLNETARREATCLYLALRTAREMVKARIYDTLKIRREMRAVIKATCRSAKVDYIAFTEFDSLSQVKTVAEKTICSLAVRLHRIRLIDNMRLK